MATQSALGTADAFAWRMLPLALLVVFSPAVPSPVALAHTHDATRLAAAQAAPAIRPEEATSSAPARGALRLAGDGVVDDAGVRGPSDAVVAAAVGGAVGAGIGAVATLATAAAAQNRVLDVPGALVVGMPVTIPLFGATGAAIGASADKGPVLPASFGASVGSIGAALAVAIPGALAAWFLADASARSVDDAATVSMPAPLGGSSAPLVVAIVDATAIGAGIAAAGGAALGAGFATSWASE